jgi:hypothetical protein
MTSGVAGREMELEHVVIRRTGTAAWRQTKTRQIALAGLSRSLNGLSDSSDGDSRGGRTSTKPYPA